MNSDGDPLDEAFASGPYLDDGGFTDRVMERLPPARRSARVPILLGFAIGAGALGVGLILGPASSLVPTLAGFSLHEPATIGALAAMIGVFASGVIAAAGEMSPS
jgi:hypothetical protein